MASSYQTSTMSTRTRSHSTSRTWQACTSLCCTALQMTKQVRTCVQVLSCWLPSCVQICPCPAEEWLSLSTCSPLLVLQWYRATPRGLAGSTGQRWCHYRSSRCTVRTGWACDSCMKAGAWRLKRRRGSTCTSASAGSSRKSLPSILRMREPALQVLLVLAAAAAGLDRQLAADQPMPIRQ